MAVIIVSAIYKIIFDCEIDTLFLFFKVILCSTLILAAIATANAKAVPEAKAQRPPQYASAPIPIAAGPPLAALEVGPAKPYSYAYEVIDPAGGNAYGHREQSDGVITEGEYRVVLPDTRTQIVT